MVEVICLNPAHKVWCLAGVTLGRTGRASHKFTLSYHLIAARARNEPAGRQKFGPREIAPELSMTDPPRSGKQKYTARLPSRARDAR